MARRDSWTRALSGTARRVNEIYLGYSPRQWWRRTVLILGFACVAYGLGSLIADKPDQATFSFLLGFVVFVKIVAWSYIRSGGRPQ
jgi:hypothetical protein